jgi:hypothetical protein
MIWHRQVHGRCKIPLPMLVAIIGHVMPHQNPQALVGNALRIAGPPKAPGFDQSLSGVAGWVTIVADVSKEDGFAGECIGKKPIELALEGNKLPNRRGYLLAANLQRDAEIRE